MSHDGPASVSIVVPCFNAERWLEPTLESALAQTWPEKEVVVVDDGSFDDSRSVAARYESRGVRLVAEPHRGAAAARNRGLEVARGDFIQFLDADDLLAPDKIELQMTLLLPRVRGGLVASGSWARFERDPSEARFAREPNHIDLSGIEFLRLHFRRGWMMHPAAWLVPRTVANRAGPWNESLSLNDDGEYFARVLLAADGIAFCEGARSYYRSNSKGSLSSRRDAEALDSLYRSADSILDRMLAADPSAETRAAVADGWRWTAFELYPGAPHLARAAEDRCRALGGSRRPLPGGRKFRVASRVLGWRLAKRLFC